MSDRRPTEADEARLHHRDVASLPTGELWGERLRVEYTLARRLFARVRPRVIWWHEGEPIVDQAWLTERAGRLANELERRGCVR